MLAPSAESRLLDPFLEPSLYGPDFSSILDDCYPFWDFPDVSQDVSRDTLQTPVPEWTDAMGLTPGMLPPSSSSLCMEGVQQLYWDRTQPTPYDPPPLRQVQPVSSSTCMAMDFSLRVGCTPQGSVASRRLHMQRDITAFSRTNKLMHPTLPINPHPSTAVAQSTESSVPGYPVRQGTPFPLGHSVVSTSSLVPQASASRCPTPDQRPIYVRVGNYAVPYTSSPDRPVEGRNEPQEAFPSTSPGPLLASHPVGTTGRQPLLPTPCRLYITDEPRRGEQAWDLRQSSSGPHRTLACTTARELLLSKGTTHPYRTAPSALNGTPRQSTLNAAVEESLKPSPVGPSPVAAAPTGALPEDGIGHLASGGIGTKDLKEKRRAVESRPHVAVQYKMVTLKIGSFTVSCLEDEPASRLGGKFRIVFSRRRFIYEFEACSSVSDGQMRTCCVIVPFQAVVALRCDDDSLTLQVQSRPIIFFGRKAQRKPGNTLDVTRLIRAAYLEYYPIHQVQLQPHDACQVRHKLWEYSPRFHDLMLRQICGADTRLQHPLPPYNSSARWTPAKPRAQKTQEVQSKQPAAISTRLLPAGTGDPAADSKCSCRVSCRSAASCPCAKARVPCDPQQCSCTACDNPLNLLQKLGVNLEDARSDICLMHSIYEIRDLSWYLWQHVQLSCNSEGALVRECLPGRKPCPRCGAPSQFSWCTNALFHDTMVYHCPICARCNFQTGTHCPKCNLCYVFGNLGKKCPRCGIFEPAASEVAASAAETLPLACSAQKDVT